MIMTRLCPEVFTRNPDCRKCNGSDMKCKRNPLVPEHWITTTIKWKYMKRILDGSKKIEYKNAQKMFWITRLFKYLGKHEGDLGINFVVNKRSYKFLVTEVKQVFIRMGLPSMDIDGEKCGVVFEIHLGDRLL